MADDAKAISLAYGIGAWLLCEGDPLLTQEHTMRQYAFSICVLMAALALLGVGGCKQEGPAENAGAHSDKAVEAVEESSETLTGTAARALDKAKAVGTVLEEAAENTAEQVQEATE